MMDENFKDSLNVCSAACLTFGYDGNILNEKKKSYSSMLYKAGFSQRARMVFGHEYSLLKKGGNAAIMGLRSMELSSIISNITRKNYLKKLFENVAKKDICDYACSFLKKYKFSNINTQSINFEYSRIAKLLGLGQQKIKHAQSTFEKLSEEEEDELKRLKRAHFDDNYIKKINRYRRDERVKELRKKFSPNSLKKANMDKILSCDNIFVQNMDSLNMDFKPLETKELEELRQVLRMYTGDRYNILNGILRGRIHPLYDGSSLEKIIEVYNKKLNETKKYLELYEPFSDRHDLYILPLDAYNKIKDACRDLSNKLRTEKFTGTLWRAMSVRALREMLNGGIKDSIPCDIKSKLKNNDKSFIAKMNDQLKGEIIMDRACLSTSCAGGIVYLVNLDRNAIALKINAKEMPGILVGNYAQFENEKEFLAPPKTKLKILSVTEYDGNNKGGLKSEFVQINCVNV